MLLVVKHFILLILIKYSYNLLILKTNIVKYPNKRMQANYKLNGYLLSQGCKLTKHRRRLSAVSAAQDVSGELFPLIPSLILRVPV